MINSVDSDDRRRSSRGEYENRCEEFCNGTFDCRCRNQKVSSEISWYEFENSETAKSASRECRLKGVLRYINKL